MGLKSRVRKTFTPTTTQADPSKRPAPNTLDRDFTAERPNQKWVTDITYLPTAMGWVYLAAVIDLFSRRVVGWAMSDSLATPLVSEALCVVRSSRVRPNPGELLHHSDRGSQYTSDDYRKTLKTLGIECSMSRRRRLLRQRGGRAVLLVAQARVDQARNATPTWIRSASELCSSTSKCSTIASGCTQALGYQTPEEFEADHALALAA